MLGTGTVNTKLAMGSSFMPTRPVGASRFAAIRVGGVAPSMAIQRMPVVTNPAPAMPVSARKRDRNPPGDGVVPGGTMGCSALGQFSLRGCTYMGGP